ncbi:MAG: (2Fe-2S)-binding protein [Acidimicrobiia bacterium]
MSNDDAYGDDAHRDDASARWSADLDRRALRRALVRINGRAQLIATEERTTLVELLRDELGLTGTKEVCGMGDCGACTVIVDDDAVYSCLVLAAECDGHEVETIEGQARGGQLSNVQEAFIACDALQCGFCTPGQVLAVEAELRRASPADDAALVEALSGNLCRCGAYRHLIDAARLAARRAAGAGAGAVAP